jgi:hypothetical protein
MDSLPSLTDDSANVSTSAKAPEIPDRNLYMDISRQSKDPTSHPENGMKVVDKSKHQYHSLEEEHLKHKTRHGAYRNLHRQPPVHHTSPHHPYSHSPEDIELQSLHRHHGHHVHDTDDWETPTRFTTSIQDGLQFFKFHITRTGVRCIRSIAIKVSRDNPNGETDDFETYSHMSMLGPLFHRQRFQEQQDAEKKGEVGYLVVGRLSARGWLMNETVVRWKRGDEKALIKDLRARIREVRGVWDYLSLKSVSGFGLYEVGHSIYFFIFSIVIYYFCFLRIMKSLLSNFISATRKPASTPVLSYHPHNHPSCMSCIKHTRNHYLVPPNICGTIGSTSTLIVTVMFPLREGTRSSCFLAGRSGDWA